MDKQLQLEKKGEFFGADFHVHTPSSSCYKGDDNEEEYLNILHEYISKDIKVIAITDHNSIKGYKRIIQIKNSLDEELKMLSNLATRFSNKEVSIEIENEIKEIRTRLEVFNQILILPGVEFEAKPGIHMLLVFDPATELGLIEKLLNDSGYSEETQGREKLDVIANIDVIDLLELSASFNCISIASHVDSHKGIYNDLSGTYRASIFKSNNLMGISYNNPNVVNSIRSMLQNKEYKRESPIAFLQCSDYHGGMDEPGSNITYLRMNTINFESVKAAIQNPNECVSATQHPEERSILEQIINDHRSICFKNINEEQSNSIKEAICAILNEGYGTLVIGACDSQNIIGIKKDKKEQCLEIINSLYQDIKPTSKILRETYFSLGDRFVLICRISPMTNELFYFGDNEVYILKNQRPIKADIGKIQDILESNVLERMSKYEDVNKVRISNLMNEVDLISRFSNKYRIINNIERRSIKFGNIIDKIHLIQPFTKEFEDQFLGHNTGNIYYAEQENPRFPYAYLRCSCPKTSRYSIDELGLDKYNQNGIIIVPGGGTYLIDSQENWGFVSLEKSNPILFITILEEMAPYFSEYALLGWLKSSLFISYSSIALGNTDIYKPEIFNKIPIPNIDQLKPDKEVEKKVCDIIEKENYFLNKIVEACNYSYDCDECEYNVKEDSDSDYCELIKTHNIIANTISYKIDKLFYEAFNVSIDDQKVIKQILDAKELYSYEGLKTSVISEFNEVASTKEEE
ncbi:MAG: RNA-binding domain-containing protein [bacterium]